jgi:hypothetical protein
MNSEMRSHIKKIQIRYCSLTHKLLLLCRGDGERRRVRLRVCGDGHQGVPVWRRWRRGSQRVVPCVAVQRRCVGPDVRTAV